MVRVPFLMAGAVALAVACGIPAAVAQNLKADPLVQKCDDVADPYRKNGVTTEMAEGLRKTNECLENVFLDQVPILFQPEIYDRKRARADLNRMREPFINIYRKLYTDNRGCPCGTIQSLVYPNEYRLFLIQVIKLAIDEQNRHRVFRKKRPKGAPRNDSK